MNATLNATARHGRVTLPVEVGSDDAVRSLMRRWGADAIRDCDGTSLPETFVQDGLDVYSTICLVRAEQEYPRTHPQHLPQKYLLSRRVTATGPLVEIPLLDGLHPDKYRIDAEHANNRYWDVTDRVTGASLPEDAWRYDPASQSVVITAAEPYHAYTVSFLAYVIWDTTSMYNHLTNQWTGPHTMNVDPYHGEAWDHLMAFYDRWLAEHAQTSVVRLTSLAYHFDVNCDVKGNDTFRDWMGYQETVSVAALDDFEREYGYRMRPEDFVDEGYYNAAGRVPSSRYLDWMQFVQRFVVRFGKALTDKAHAAGKRVAVFHGDHWVGLEPFSNNATEIGIDIHVGAAEDGVALRRVSDTPGTMLREVRLYPYFFPDVFREGGNPLDESLSNWIKIRRALLRRSVDRIGYGGYLSLAAKFPAFCSHVENLCEEFRTIRERSGGTRPWSAPIKVAVINAWGACRSWLNSFGREQKFFSKRTDVIQVAGSNLLECLAGLPVEVSFLSLQEIRDHGVPSDVNVLINDGDAETAWSGGAWWKDATVVTEVRRFVAEGGGLLGCRGPSAIQHQGRCFQLADVLGVDYENGYGIHNVALPFEVQQEHFITENLHDADLSLQESFVYCAEPDTAVLRSAGKHVHLACRRFEAGRSAYVAGLPYSLANARLLWRTLLWLSRNDARTMPWCTDNWKVDCAYYPETSGLVVVNNAQSTEAAAVELPSGMLLRTELSAWESCWFDVDARGIVTGQPEARISPAPQA